jgi:outer membrane protein TolC
LLVNSIYKMKNRLNFSLIILFALLARVSGQELPEIISLEQCYDLALENNWQLKAAQADIAVADLEIQKSRTAFFPAIEGNSTINSFNIPDFALNAFTWNNTLSASQTLLDFGRRRKIVASNTAQRQSANVDYRLIWLDIKQNIALSYVNVLQNQEVLEILKQRNQNDKALLDEINERYTLGVTRYSNLLQARVAFNNSNVAVAMAEKNLENSLNQLSLPLNTALETVNRVEGQLATLFELPLVEFDIGAVPEMQRAEAQIQAQQANLSSAAAENKPTVAAFATAGFGNSIFIDYGFIWNAGVNLTVPLFNAGRIRKNTEQERLRLNRLDVEKKGLGWQIERQLQSADIAIAEVRQRIDNLSFALESAKENLEIAEGEFREGLTAFNNVTDARILSLNAALEYINALADLRRVEIQKLRILGIL